MNLWTSSPDSYSANLSLIRSSSTLFHLLDDCYRTPSERLIRLETAMNKVTIQSARSICCIHCPFLDSCTHTPLVPYTHTLIVSPLANSHLHFPSLGLTWFTPIASICPLTLFLQVLNRLEVLDHHFEHHFSNLQDNVDDIKGKLDKREKEAEDRIKVLEDLMKKEVGICYMPLLTSWLLDYSLIIPILSLLYVCVKSVDHTLMYLHTTLTLVITIT